MNKKILLSLLVFMLAAQWLVPGKLIYDSEKTSEEGTLFKFRVRPVDPYDPFRGKYITLDFEDNTVMRDTLEDFYSGQSAFVLVEPDSLGFASLKAVSHNSFLETNYFEATVSWQDRTVKDSLQSIHLDLPFKKYFMEETFAPEAEVAYSETRRDSIPAYALVSVMNGKAVLRDVIIHDSSIVDVVRARMGKK